MLRTMTLWNGVTLQGYGTCVAIGLVLAYAYVVRAARGLRVREHEVAGFFFLSLVAALLGARAGFWIQGDWSSLFANPSQFLGEAGGFSLSGALGALVAICPIGLRLRSIPVLPFLAAAAPAAAMGEALTRLGCLLNGCCYGRVTSLPWGGAQPDLSGDFHARHPTQVYEALALLAAAWLLHRMRARGALPVTVVSVWLMAVSGERLGIEYLRGDVRLPEIGFTQTQLVCAALFAAAVLALVRGLSASGSSRCATGRNPSGPARVRQVVFRHDGRSASRSRIHARVSRLASGVLDDSGGTNAVEVEIPDRC